MTKIRMFVVDTVNGEVDMDEIEFDSYSDMFEFLIDEYGEVDINGNNIKDQYGNNEIKIEGDVYIVKVEVL